MISVRVEGRAQDPILAGGEGRTFRGHVTDALVCL
jgi:hypothetical protein